MRKDRILLLLRSVWNCVPFFLLISFVATCCLELFLLEMQRSMGVVFSKENIESAAKLTFGNVVLISLFCTLIDGVRRWYTVTRPVRRIAAAAEKVMAGDLSVRIQPVRGLNAQDGFNVTINYFNRMVQELSGIETLRTDFIANVSHELKTPLAVIQNYAVMLQQANLPEEQRAEYAKTIVDASCRLSDLITNILKLNKLENQQIYPEKTVYDLGEQLCQCLLSFEDAWEGKDIELETDLAEDVLIESDAELLMLVWNNLISNALKFTPVCGRVAVSLEGVEDFAVVRITDTGCGIPPEVGERIFEKFYQGDTSHAAQGNGLGLALVKRVVDIVGGDISVDSEVGRGSSFAVKIRRMGNGTS